MDANRTSLLRELGEGRYWNIRLRVFEKHAVNLFSRPGAKLVEVSGPQKMEIIERERKAVGKLPVRVDNRVLGRTFSKDGNTIPA
jgi:hypothetical protein